MHIAASATAGTVTALAVDPGFGMALFAAGSALDMDHLELFLASGLPGRPDVILEGMLHNEESLEKKYGFSRNPPKSWAFPVLHSIELTVLCATLGLALENLVFLGIAAGLFLHILMDLRNYPESPRFFSLAWRGLARNHLMQAWESWKPRSGP